MLIYVSGCAWGVHVLSAVLSKVITCDRLLEKDAFRAKVTFVLDNFLSSEVKLGRILDKRACTMETYLTKAMVIVAYASFHVPVKTLRR